MLNGQTTLQLTCNRADTEEPGESGGNSGGPELTDILFFFNLKNSSETINEDVSFYYSYHITKQKTKVHQVAKVDLFVYHVNVMHVKVSFLSYSMLVLLISMLYVLIYYIHSTLNETIRKFQLR
jgi:hypothetical protein